MLSKRSVLVRTDVFVLLHAVLVRAGVLAYVCAMRCAVLTEGVLLPGGLDLIGFILPEEQTQVAFPDPATRLLRAVRYGDSGSSVWSMQLPFLARATHLQHETIGFATDCSLRAAHM